MNSRQGRNLGGWSCNKCAALFDNASRGSGRRISGIPSRGYTSDIAAVDPEYRDALEGGHSGSPAGGSCPMCGSSDLRYSAVAAYQGRRPRKVTVSWANVFGMLGVLCIIGVLGFIGWWLML